jgi:CRISPR-associated endonuclease/helicase Cas3
MAVDFDAFYRAVHSKSPFPWQRALAEQVLSGAFPQAVAIPTGCGKTSLIDIAVFALAAQADRPALERSARLRIFFVVDRRLVVDDAFSHAAKIAKAIANEPGETLAWVRDRLKSFGGPRPLDIAILRGGMYRSDTWADAPNQPLVCVSTVDQVGSRLLFRGYGVSASRQPIHAGLVGNDSIIILDEAHLSTACRDTLKWVERYQSEAWRQEQVAPGLRVVAMSATLQDQPQAIKLTERDLKCEALKDRLTASKAAALREVTNVAQAAADEAMQLVKAGGGVTGIVLNTVRTARAAFKLLNENNDAILLTGRVRPYDRDRLIEKHLSRMRAGREPRGADPFFVVATQTIEVGADLDFDALVTEIASLDSLRQRFGRLDRLGTQRSTQAVILQPKRSKDRGGIYGEAADKTWEWLQKHSVRENGSASIDFGVLNMSRLVETETADGLNMPALQGPLVFPAHLDAWAQTNPAPAAESDVDPFLHGPRKPNADVQIVWRTDLEDDNPEKWIEMLAAAPPVSTEALALPISEARRWLRGVAKGEVADIETGLEEEDEQSGVSRRFLIWRGPQESKAGTLRDLRPGQTIVVRSIEGGCDEFGWKPESTNAVRDIGDLCANERVKARGGRYRIRLHPAVLFPEPGQEEIRNEFAALLKRVDEDETDMTALKDFVSGHAGDQILLSEAVEECRWDRAKPYGGSTYLIVESDRIPPAEASATPAEEDETDEDDEQSLTLEVPLSKHVEGVKKKAESFAAGCGLAKCLQSAISAAAQLHDEGKRDERFQAVLSPRRNPRCEPLAKGERCSAREFARRRADFELPKGFRHEFKSVELAKAATDWAHGCDRELVLYLIGSHHGYGRAMAPFWPEPNGGPQVAALDSGWADRYWSLIRRYGWWGLAYLEAILRRADCVRSREEEREAARNASY